MTQQIDEFRYQLDHLQGVWTDGHSTAEQTLFLIADVLIAGAETLDDILAATTATVLDDILVSLERVADTRVTG